MNDLRRYCQEIMEDSSVTSRYPDGMNAGDILAEIRVKRPSAFPLVSVLDVCDEMNALYPK